MTGRSGKIEKEIVILTIVILTGLYIYYNYYKQNETE
jgi:hypothetical protein